MPSNKFILIAVERLLQATCFSKHIFTGQRAIRSCRARAAVVRYERSSCDYIYALAYTPIGSTLWTQAVGVA